MTGRSWRLGRLNAKRRHEAVTLVEVLVALAVLAVLGAALAALQLSALRTERANQDRHVAASALEQELLYQRVGPGAAPGPCQAAYVPPGWRCSVAASCAHTAAPCVVWAVEVVVTPQNGPALTGRTVRFDPLAGPL